MKLFGFIGEGDSETVLLMSEMFKGILNEYDIESVGEFNAEGRGNLLKRKERIESYFKIFEDRGAERVFVLSDLELEACISLHKQKLYQYSSSKVDIVAVKAIESWLLSDMETLQNMLKKRFQFEEPEKTTNLPLEELQNVFMRETGRGLGKSKPKIMKIFLFNGFSLNSAADHPNNKSAKYFLRKLQEFSEE